MRDPGDPWPVAAKRPSGFEFSRALHGGQPSTAVVEPRSRNGTVRHLGQTRGEGREGRAVGTSHQMDDATQSLVRTLRASGTDLAKLIEFCVLRRPPVVYVAEPAVTAWETRAPAA
jgi:hypothetical protein